MEANRAGLNTMVDSWLLSHCGFENCFSTGWCAVFPPWSFRRISWWGEMARWGSLLPQPMINSLRPSPTPSRQNVAKSPAHRLDCLSPFIGSWRGTSSSLIRKPGATCRAYDEGSSWLSSCWTFQTQETHSWPGRTVSNYLQRRARARARLQHGAHTCNWRHKKSDGRSSVVRENWVFDALQLSNSATVVFEGRARPGPTPSHPETTHLPGVEHKSTATIRVFGLRTTTQLLVRPSTTVKSPTSGWCTFAKVWTPFRRNVKWHHTDGQKRNLNLNPPRQSFSFSRISITEWGGQWVGNRNFQAIEVNYTVVRKGFRVSCKSLQHWQSRCKGSVYWL